jgi:hypothetical protein
MPDGLVGSELLRMGLRVGRCVCLYLPRNVDVGVLTGYAGEGGVAEIESVVLDGREKGVCAWYWRDGEEMEE